MSESSPYSEINIKYVKLFEDLFEKYKYNSELSGSLTSDMKHLNDGLIEDNNYVVDFITDNYLDCLEQINDHNSDYFLYQKTKIKRKNGKYYKNKISKIGNTTDLKKILRLVDKDTSNKVFNEIIQIFELLTIKDENGIITFKEEYITYVKEKYTEHRYFSKMIMVFDNINTILENKFVEEKFTNAVVTSESTNDKKSSNNKNNKKNNKQGKGEDFMKGIENTKIAELAKTISQKINAEDFPLLSDPSKLLSSLGNMSSDNGDNGIQNLLKFVVSEVEGAFKDKNINEKDLIGEAQNIMGQFQNMSGFDPMSILKNDNIDMNQFANIFSKLAK
jgi:hypothetical protein